MRHFLFSLILFAFPAATNAWASELSPHLSAPQFNRIQSLLSAGNGAHFLERTEREYQKLVNRQVLADLILVYDPKNSKSVRTTYASFSATHSGGGDDLGFGLHIVKRLDLVFPSGVIKTVYVNELWPEDPNTGGLFAPDEIRVQTRFRKTRESTDSGSHNDYLFDSLRLAWGVGPEEVEIHRQTTYEDDAKNGLSHSIQRRVPVSAPLSCQGCHDNENSFGDTFLMPGEQKNFEAIVQDSAFSLPISEMKGFKEYVLYLQNSKRSPEVIERAKTRLADISSTANIPGLLGALQSAQGKGISWLPSDFPLTQPETAVTHRQGSYLFQGIEYLDAIENTIEGKYRWWFPALFFQVR